MTKHEAILALIAGFTGGFIGSLLGRRSGRKAAKREHEDAVRQSQGYSSGPGKW